MGFRDLFTRSKKVPAARRDPAFARRAARGYQAAVTDLLTSSWGTSITSAGEGLKAALRPMRARSRELAENNDYMVRFIAKVKTNVVGSFGVKLQMKIEDAPGKLDTAANAKVEAAWADWGKLGTCSMDGMSSFVDLQNLFMGSTAVDGEALFRIIKGPAAGNIYGFALHHIEADHLSEDMNVASLANGNRIHMSVELNSWGRPVAYYILNRHPGDSTYTFSGRSYVRVPASEIIHAYVPGRANQTRGVPWAHSAMTRLNMLAGYEEAELVAARVGATKMAFFTSPDGEGFGEEKDDTGAFIQEGEPGTFDVLPQGYGIETFDPQHPNSGFQAFEKAILRGIASGLGISYNSLANDLEGVNFSSLRQGAIEERDEWRKVQTWFISRFCERIFAEWLEMAMTTGAVSLPLGKFDKFNKAEWRPRGWQWVDPNKEVAAAKAAVQLGIRSRTQVAAEQGRDFGDTLLEIAAENALAEELGVSLTEETDTDGKEDKPDDD